MWVEGGDVGACVGKMHRVERRSQKTLDEVLGEKREGER